MFFDWLSFYDDVQHSAKYMVEFNNEHPKKC